MKQFNEMLYNLRKNNEWLRFKRIVKDVNSDPDKDKRKGEYVDMLCDFIFLWCGRSDDLDDDIVKLYMYDLKTDKQREILTMFFIDWNSIENINWKRGFKDWEYDKLVDLLEKTDRPLSVMVVCCRCWLNEVLKGRLEFTANDFIPVIQYCKWKKLDIY